MRYLRGTMDYAIEYSGFPAVLEGYSDANWGFLIQMRQNLLVVMYLHLVVVQLHRDQPDKPLLLDQQWNQSLLLLKWLVVKLSG